jgi:hypothetical protein
MVREVRDQCLANGVGSSSSTGVDFGRLKARWARMESQFLSLAGLAEMAAE